MSLKILYGIKGHTQDVTDICLSKLTKNNIITIPPRDNMRTLYFSDHLYGIKKRIFVIINETEYEYTDVYLIKINIEDNTIKVSKSIDTCTYIDDKIIDMHAKLKINHGNLYGELPEQFMAVRYLTGSEKVLEIGGNIGRNSLMIASIVNNNTFVTLESDMNIAKQLEENRNLNNFTFHIENAALSKRKLIQKDWNTKPSEMLEEGYTWVNTITLDELNNKYNIKFDTLILDCEGAFYYILMDMPEILNGIELIIMENDYTDISHKEYIDSVLIENNFYRDYMEQGGWGCCYNNFFEVWKKLTI